MMHRTRMVKNFSMRILLTATGLLSVFFTTGCTSSGADTVANGNNGNGGGSANSAPSISGAPASAVNVNQVWNVTPTASDPDGDPLTFSVQNAPDWATTFDATTGMLAGTPTAGDVGIYSDIRISVSDGSLSDDLGPFSVEVTQVALGSATVNLSLPTQYNDGSSLNGHIETINIYYGVLQGNLLNKIQISNIGTTSYVVDNLVPDTYFFGATLVDDQGAESGLSNIGSVTVQ